MSMHYLTLLQTSDLQLLNEVSGYQEWKCSQAYTNKHNEMIRKHLDAPKETQRLATEVSTQSQSILKIEVIHSTPEYTNRSANYSIRQISLHNTTCARINRHTLVLLSQ